MKFSRVLYIFISPIILTQITPFSSSRVYAKKIFRLEPVLLNNPQNDNNNVVVQSENKLRGFVKLIRPKSIPPTLFLCISGGWIMNPSFYNLLNSKEFLTSIACTLLVLTGGMVINDVYDVNVDKINNPDRPIASGQIKIYEAIGLNILLIGSAKYLSFRFFPENLQLFLDFVIIIVGLYTSLFKRIPGIKNISCAGVVSLTLLFSGIASNNRSVLIVENKNFGLLSLTLSLIFYGSLSNEILLDIRDCDGDKINNIYTLPVIFGKDNALILANFITNVSIMSNSTSLTYLTNNYYYGLILFVLCLPISINFFNIRNKDYSKKNIMKIINNTTAPMFVMLLYICILARQGL